MRGGNRTNGEAHAPRGGRGMNNSIPPSSEKAPIIDPNMGADQFVDDEDDEDAFAKKIFKHNLFGDVFGTRTAENMDRSMLGMLYRARISDTLFIEQKTKAVGEEKVEDATSNLGSSVGSVDMFENESDSEEEIMEVMNPRQQLATTIRNWSVMPENDKFIIQEGAVHALIALAGVDDQQIRKCCAFALYYLSTRIENREELLSLGAATGIITIAMQVRSWKIARVCSQTLCYLSMHHGGEAIMARDGAILALVILLGLKGQRLLPISVQALYNLTVVAHHFKGMERVVKALLNLPPTPYDSSLYFLKSLVNCSRYSWMRLRIIEDGAMAGVAALMPTLASRENKQEVVSLIATSLRSLSESQGCRLDMIQKGALDILYTLLPFCDDESRLLVAKTLHNFLQLPIRPAAFEKFVTMVGQIIYATDNESLLQYSAACVAIFTGEKLKGNKIISNHLIDVVPKLLVQADPLTQFFAVASSGNLFFDNACDDFAKIEAMLVTFVSAGSSIADLDAVVSLSVALAKLSQEPRYMDILEGKGLLKGTLELLLKLVTINTESMLVREACCIAITRITIQLCVDEDCISQELKEKIAAILVHFLDSDDKYVLGSSIAAVRSLGERFLCHKELLSEAMLTKVAGIAMRNEGDVLLCCMCCAVLAVFSYEMESHSMLATDKILDVVFSMTKTEDSVTREMVATIICNISVNEGGSRRMIEKGVVEVLATLSGATSELIQELCAKCICNLTCVADLHQTIIANKVLQTILMISLVRSVASTTKQYCALSILNLMSQSQNAEALVEAGAVRVFATLCSNLNNPLGLSICARGFVQYTSSKRCREDLVQRRPVLQALFGMVKCTSARTRIVVGMAVCNMLACPATQKAMIHAGALPVFKIIATMDYDELREAAARVIIVLMQSPALYPLLLRDSLVPVLILILQESLPFTFECATNALCCMAQVEAFRIPLLEHGVVSALVAVIVAGRVDTKEMSTKICRCLCLLSYVTEYADTMILEGHVFLGLHILYRCALVTPECATLIALLIRNLSEMREVRDNIVREGGFKLLASICRCFESKHVAISRAVTIVAHNLGNEESLHEAMLDEGFVALLHQVVLPQEPVSHAGPRILQSDLQELCKAEPSQPLVLTQADVLHVATALRLVSHTASCKQRVVQGNVVNIFRRVLDLLNEESLFEVGCTFKHLAGSKVCRQILVDQGAAELLISLSRMTGELKTQGALSLALGHLSEITRVKNGVVSSLLNLSLQHEDDGAKRADLSGSGMTSNTGLLTNTDTESAAFAAVISDGDDRAPVQGSKSLRQMIKDGLQKGGIKSLKDDGSASGLEENFRDVVTAKKEKGVSKIVTLVHSLKAANQPSYCMGSAESIRHEIESHFMLFEKYFYMTYLQVLAIEKAGISNDLQIELALPTLATDRELGLPNRHADLTKVPIQMNALPKDTHIVETFSVEAAPVVEEVVVMESVPNTGRPLTDREDHNTPRQKHLSKAEQLRQARLKGKVANSKLEHFPDPNRPKISPERLPGGAWRHQHHPTGISGKTSPGPTHEAH